MNEGWECPKCGKVLAPWVRECDHVISTRFSYTYTIPAGLPEPLPEPQPWPDYMPWPGITGNDPRAITTWSM